MFEKIKNYFKKRKLKTNLDEQFYKTVAYYEKKKRKKELEKLAATGISATVTDPHWPISSVKARKNAEEKLNASTDWPTENPVKQMERMEQAKLLDSLKPILLARGRRVFGNLKKSQPKTVLVEDITWEPIQSIVLCPAPGGQLVSAYVVDTEVDKRCLRMAISYSKDGGGADFYDNTDIVINGVPVICKGEIKE